MSVEMAELRREFWERAYLAALSCEDIVVLVAADAADRSLAEWDKRWNVIAERSFQDGNRVRFVDGVWSSELEPGMFTAEETVVLVDGIKVARIPAGGSYKTSAAIRIVALRPGQIVCESIK